MCSLFGILAKLVYYTQNSWHIQTTKHTRMQHRFILFHAIAGSITICSIRHPRRLHFFRHNAFFIVRGSSQHTTRRHEGGGGGDASARHRCGLAVAGATRRHALGDTRRCGRPGAHPIPIARPRLKRSNRSDVFPTSPADSSTPFSIDRSSSARRRRSRRAAAPPSVPPRSA